ncbi:arabinose-5-phosphate isomerase [Formosimonas limnophila]|uniref:Arabinose-5-phosphate isomerase n=2 Tax=Formosimonas limnophila TaxID=1384487 RepID=A0A8J3CN04_9BURK|nr:arabinose-5-phosphate isomerase [Formosimonas limnophila]
MMITNNPPVLNDTAILNIARDVLDIESTALSELKAQLDENFVHAVRTILSCKGRLVVSGMGKSGHIARKIAATFASTGTPSFFVHPGEASHGDLGMITEDDVMLALSNSGKSDELMAILPFLKRYGTRLIAMTGDSTSPMAKLADVHLLVKVNKEACPMNLAPTASTTAALALGDALAVALLKLHGFNEEDFARSHPGGALGKRLLTYVRDVMRTGDEIPSVVLGSSLTTALLEISRKRMGMTAVVDETQKVLGILTDGDVRRLFEKDVDVRTLVIDDAMHRAPHTISPDALAVSAVQLLDTHHINQVLVTDEQGVLLGALNVHDLFAAKVM